VGFFLFCLDQIIKFLSLRVFTNKFIVLKFFGWNPFQNHGVAFSLPLPNIATILFTIPIILIIAWLLIKYFFRPTHLNFFIGLSFIFWGAMSNLIDRVIYKTTIDYFLIGTGVINLADVLIVAGFIFYLLPHKFFKS
jgi:lipoprotein signal peptidase